MVKANDLYERLNALYDDLRDAEELLSNPYFSEDDIVYVNSLIDIINKRIHELKHTLNLLGVNQNEEAL